MEPIENASAELVAIKHFPGLAFALTGDGDARPTGRPEDEPLPEDFLVFADGDSVGTAGPEGSQKTLPTRNLYRGPGGGYVAVYTRDREAGVYGVGGGIYVVGQIRLRGRYRGRIFSPEGFENTDISAHPAMKALVNEVFPGLQGGGWAGGDTGGWYGY